MRSNPLQATPTHSNLVHVCVFSSHLFSVNMFNVLCVTLRIWLRAVIFGYLYFPAPSPLLGLRPWPPISFTGPDPWFVFTCPGPQFMFTGTGTQVAFNSPGSEFLFIGKFVFSRPGICYLPVQVKILLLLLLLQLLVLSPPLPSPPPPLLLIVLLEIITTRDTFAAAKSPLNGP